MIVPRNALRLCIFKILKAGRKWNEYKAHAASQIISGYTIRRGWRSNKCIYLRLREMMEAFVIVLLFPSIQLFLHSTLDHARVELFLPSIPFSFAKEECLDILRRAAKAHTKFFMYQLKENASPLCVLPGKKITGGQSRDASKVCIILLSRKLCQTSILSL